MSSLGDWKICNRKREAEKKNVQPRDWNSACAPVAKLSAMAWGSMPLEQGEGIFHVSLPSPYPHPKSRDEAVDACGGEASVTTEVPRGENKDEIQMAGKFSEIQIYVFLPVVYSLSSLT